MLGASPSGHPCMIGSIFVADLAVAPLAKASLHWIDRYTFLQAAYRFIPPQQSQILSSHQSSSKRELLNRVRYLIGCNFSHIWQRLKWFAETALNPAISMIYQIFHFTTNQKSSLLPWPSESKACSYGDYRIAVSHILPLCSTIRWPSQFSRTQSQ